MYAFPLPSIMGKVLRKARLDHANLILIALHWPDEPRFLDLPGLTHGPPLKPRGAGSNQVRGAARESRHAGPSRIALVRKSQRSLGASRHVLSLVAWREPVGREHSLFVLLTALSGRTGALHIR